MKSQCSAERLYYILSSFNYTSKRWVLIGLSRRILVLMMASAENVFFYFLYEKSLHLILIARTKNPPARHSHIIEATTINIVSPCVFSLLFNHISYRWEETVVRCRAPPRLISFPPTVMQTEPLWQITLSIWPDLLMQQSRAALRVPKTHIQCSNLHAGSPTLSSVVIVLAVDYN